MKLKTAFITLGLILVSQCFVSPWGKASSSVDSRRTILIFDAQTKEVEAVDKIEKTVEEWKRELTAEQFQITRKKGTERPFSGRYYDHKEKGVYQCVCCGTDLFRSDTKFDSGTGWPSFWAPVADQNLAYQEDNSHFVHRTEVLCPRCDAHLGHVFDDGPPPTHKRFCVNSAALKFVKS